MKEAVQYMMMYWLIDNVEVIDQLQQLSRDEGVPGGSSGAAGNPKLDTCACKEYMWAAVSECFTLCVIKEMEW